ncbi:MAG TPA: glycosyltransferase [Tepidisphaeraceae bacterium]|nr:glycosyltransferase [Tepidisphaeraceae bacterium]
MQLSSEQKSAVSPGEGSAAASNSKERPALAIISGQPTPYRLHFLGRVARELNEVRLYSVFTHEGGDNAWKVAPPQEINPVLFGPGEDARNQDKLKYAWREWRRGGRVIRWMQEAGINAVLLVGYNDPGRLRILRYCARRGIPCFLFGDSNIAGERASGVKAVLKKMFVGSVVRKCAAIMPCGSMGRKYFMKYGARAEQIFLCPYEPDYELIFKLSQEQVRGAMARFALDPDRRRIVFSGRLTWQKRPDLMVDAFVKIADSRPNWDLLILGDGELRQSLEARIPSGLRGRVVFTGFLNDQATVSALYRASDVLVLPSDFEPWALVVNEAAAAGLAIVATDKVGAAAELVRDGVNGFIFPAGDLQKLRDRLLEVTDESRVEHFKAASAGVLSDWRMTADPVNGLRQALRSCGLVHQTH